jgi:transcriptional regulator GlxA family with amidase domain
MVEPDKIFVRDGKIATSAGVSSGMDLALALVEEDFGREAALKVAQWLVLYLKRPGGQSQSSPHLAAQKCGSPTMQELQMWIIEHLAEDLSVHQLAARTNMSDRNFARQFKNETGFTPADFVDLSRVDAARRLLEDSDLPLKRICSLCGFGTPSHMRRAFLRRVSVPPGAHRERSRIAIGAAPAPRAIAGLQLLPAFGSA